MTRHDKATLGGVAQPEITGFVDDDDTVSALYYTASATPRTPQRLCHPLVPWLLAGTLLDAHVSPWLACQECCLPQPLCGCQGRG
jgi:hypothetical protein